MPLIDALSSARALDSGSMFGVRLPVYVSHGKRVASSSPRGVTSGRLNLWGSIPAQVRVRRCVEESKGSSSGGRARVVESPPLAESQNAI